MELRTFMPVPDLGEMSSPLTTVANFLSGGLWSRCVWRECVSMAQMYLSVSILCNFGGTLLSVCHRFFQVLVR